MKIRLGLALLLTAAACGKPDKPLVENVAANQTGNDDVTDVPDESGDANASENNTVDVD